MTTAGLEPATFWYRSAIEAKRATIALGSHYKCRYLPNLPNTYDLTTIMALNWTMLNPNRSPIPLPNEMTITAIDSGVDVSLTVPDAPPTNTSPAGGSGGSKKLRALGRIWLTDQRLIFTTEPGASFESLSIPLHSILSTRFEQPTFGANYLSFEVKPSPDGGLSEGTKAELRFKDRAMFEFVSLLEKTRERAIYMKRQAAEDEEGLPTYTLPAESSSASMVGGIPVENPPGYNV